MNKRNTKKANPGSKHGKSSENSDTESSVTEASNNQSEDEAEKFHLTKIDKVYALKNSENSEKDSISESRTDEGIDELGRKGENSVRAQRNRQADKINEPNTANPELSTKNRKLHENAGTGSSQVNNQSENETENSSLMKINKLSILKDLEKLKKNSDSKAQTNQKIRESGKKEERYMNGDNIEKDTTGECGGKRDSNAQSKAGENTSGFSNDQDSEEEINVADSSTSSESRRRTVGGALREGSVKEAEKKANERTQSTFTGEKSPENSGRKTIASQSKNEKTSKKEQGQSPKRSADGEGIDKIQSSYKKKDEKKSYEEKNPQDDTEEMRKRKRSPLKREEDR